MAVKARASMMGQRVRELLFVPIDTAHGTATGFLACGRSSYVVMVYSSVVLSSAKFRVAVVTGG